MPKITSLKITSLNGRKPEKISVNIFDGNLKVHIRHFYEVKETGEEKPGKHGITLSVDEWNTLKEQVSKNNILHTSNIALYQNIQHL